jgi:hypothetical protein
VTEPTPTNSVNTFSPRPDPKALLATTNSASEKVAALHIVFLAVCAYVLVIVFGTTDLDLLIGKGVKLPVVDVEVPIVGFYAMAPYLLVLVHFNLLLSLQQPLCIRRRRRVRRRRRPARPAQYFSVQPLSGRPAEPALEKFPRAGRDHYHAVATALCAADAASALSRIPKRSGHVDAAIGCLARRGVGRDILVRHYKPAG